eukprot:4355576-Pyramimonas_sp.AAC.1
MFRLLTQEIVISIAQEAREVAVSKTGLKDATNEMVSLQVAYFDRHISQNPLKTGRFKRVLEIGSGRAHFKILKFPVLEVQYVAYAGVTTLLPCRLHDGISLTPAPMHGQGTVCSRNR